MLSVPVQSIAWKDCPWNDLLCFERYIKHLPTYHSADATDTLSSRASLKSRLV